MGVDGIISGVIQREGAGRFTDNPADRGGPTRWGITAKTLGWARKLGRDATADEVRGLDETEARSIYRRMFVEDPHFDAIADPLLEELLVDAGVNSGAPNAVKMLQRALGFQGDRVDGVMGPITLNAANAFRAAPLGVRIMAERIEFLGRLVTYSLNDADRDGIPDNAEFDAGWMARCGALLRELAQAIA